MIYATGGTVDCVAKMLSDFEKRITGLNVVIELVDLEEEKMLRWILRFNIDSQIINCHLLIS